MIAFKQFLYEIFDSPHPFKMVTGTKSSEVVYQFDIGDIQYQVAIDRNAMQNGEGTGIIYLYPITFRFTRSNNTLWAYTLLKKRDGTQFKILATVKDIIFKHFSNVRLNPGDRIVFDTFDPSTANLYTKFAKELANKTQTKLNMGRPSRSGSLDFELIK